MRHFIASLALLLPAWLAGVSLAAEDGKQSNEAAQVETTPTEDVGSVQDKRGKKGRHGKGGFEGRRGGRDGQGPPNPEELFEKFDKNEDGQLSREEFLELSQSIRERHARGGKGKGPRGRRSGPRDGDRGGPPPREGRRDFRGPPPLQNPGDRPGPPLEGRRGRPGDENGPGARGRRGGPPEGGRMPDPNKVFDRFDENGDDQLSREEFRALANQMRKIRERLGNREGRGFDRDRPGPPRRGGREGSGRPGRPPGGGDNGANFVPPTEGDSTA